MLHGKFLHRRERGRRCEVYIQFSTCLACNYSYKATSLVMEIKLNIAIILTKFYRFKDAYTRNGLQLSVTVQGAMNSG